PQAGDYSMYKGCCFDRRSQCRAPLVQHATASLATARFAAHLARAALAAQATQDWPTLAAPLVVAWTKQWVSANATAASPRPPKSSSGIESASFHKCDARHHSDFSLSKCTPAKAWPREQRNCLGKPTRSVDRSPTLHLLSPSSRG